MSIGKRLLTRRLTVITLSITLIFALTGPVYANPSTDQVKNDIENDIENNISNDFGLVDSAKDTQRLEELAEKYVVTEDAEFKITNESELANNATKEEVKDLQKQVEKVNKILSDSSDSGGVTQIDDDTVRVYSKTDGENSTNGWNDHWGESHIDFHLTNVEVWLSKKLVGAIIVVSVATAATLISAEFPALPALLATNIGAALIAYFVNEIAEPAYIQVSYLGNIKDTKYGD